MEALIIVDVQNDFLPGGALAVLDGDDVPPMINQLEPVFPVIVATQDWHPANHLSFAANHPGKKPLDVINVDGLEQTLWPVHCVQNTPGASFSPQLNLSRVHRIFQKGTDSHVDSYSGFYDNGHKKSTGLGEWLKASGISRVFVCGLATDYCVKFTVLDALELGFTATLIEDACRGVNLQSDDSTRAVNQMRKAGAAIINSETILNARTRGGSHP